MRSLSSTPGPLPEMFSKSQWSIPSIALRRKVRVIIVFPHEIMHTLGDERLTLVSVCMENLYALVKKNYKPLGLVTMMEYPFISWYFREKKKPFNDSK